MVCRSRFSTCVVVEEANSTSVATCTADVAPGALATWGMSGNCPLGFGQAHGRRAGRCKPRRSWDRPRPQFALYRCKATAHFAGGSGACPSPLSWFASRGWHSQGLARQFYEPHQCVASFVAVSFLLENVFEFPPSTPSPPSWGVVLSAGCPSGGRAVRQGVVGSGGVVGGWRVSD